MMVPLAIVIPSHRRADLLERCLVSLRKYRPARTQVIVIDDGSPGAIISCTAARFDFVQVLRQAKPRGFCRSANRGIAAATAPVVELLNDDTEVTPHWADAPLARLADDPHCAAVAPLVLLGDSQTPWHTARVDSAGDGYDIGGFARKIGHGQPVSAELLHPRPVFGASASSAFYRTEVLRRLGGFAEHFGAYFEDVDLSHRLRRAGYSIWYEPASMVWHRGSASYGRRPARRILERQSCNEERVFWRHLPPAATGRALRRHAAVLIGKALRRWQEGTLVPFCLGRLRAWGELLRGTIAADLPPLLQGTLAANRPALQRDTLNAELRATLTSCPSPSACVE